ncbi:glycoside hydrolase family 38 C-terminal domain-containing protein [Microbacterium sp. PRC9]|nr:glycoside hydrolase family 38 C-terminal domain-containing protein [Microbacterium sp. PRC9]
MMRDRVLPNVNRRSAPVTVSAWHVPDEPVPFAIARHQAFAPFEVGEPWGGRPWGTTWFHVTGAIPAGWGTEPATSVELLVDLGFVDNEIGFHAEGLAWTADGRTIKGIEPSNRYIPLSGGGAIDVLIEAAANPLIHTKVDYRATPLGSTRTAGTEPIYRLAALELVERDEIVAALHLDLATLTALVDELGDRSTRGAEILHCLSRAADALDPDDVPGTAETTRKVLADVLNDGTSESAHVAIAVGHAHIDSAWLWPVRETIRKCARTFSNVLSLMDDDPRFRFACSSAQQYAWMRDHYPELFARISERVAEGRWIPVGGMWVESDTNMPGGEALVRQFVAGKRFFIEELGSDPVEGWLPDSFGYSAALPQILRGAGLKWFLTQKPSWNETNIIPHTSFEWEGIDGTRILTHLPPSDKYNSDMSQADLHLGERQNKERGVVDCSMILFGYGDGGGGPTREMLGLADRAADLDGSPRVQLGTPAQLFEAVERILPEPPVWSGEMYLEFHRGTYTSQLAGKQGNRRSEHLLREAELWATTAAVQLDADYPYEKLEEIWHTVLLQQFHDILPGSSIAWVHEVAEENYKTVIESLDSMIQVATEALAQDGPDYDPTAVIRFNAAPVPALGVDPLAGAAIAAPGLIAPEETGDGWVIDTGAIRAFVDRDGLLTSLVDVASGRDAIAPGDRGCLYTVFRDTPNRYDAWDIDRSYQRNATDIVTPESVRVIDGTLVIYRIFGQSSITTRLTATDGSSELTIESEVDWHEQQKLLKLAFPFDVKADRASSEIQFGHVDRPTHENTSWDWARYETCAHRWVHVGEPGFGVAVANDSTYGHDIARTTRRDGGTTTTVRESLVRGPVYPDPHADQGRHILRTLVRVGASVVDAADSGYRLNLPVRSVVGGSAVPALVAVHSPQVFIEAVKLAEDRSGDVIVRLYEALGGRASNVVVAFGFETGIVTRTDLLERALEEDASPRPVSWAPGQEIRLTLRPFEIVTLRAARAAATSQ